MNPEKSKLYLLSIFIPACLFSVLFVPSALCRAIAALLLAVAAGVVLVLVKKRSIPSVHHRQVTGLLAVIAVVYTVITYTAGAWVGFYRNATLTGEAFLRSVLPAAVIIVATELVRSVLLAQKGKAVSVVAFVIGVLADLALADGISGITGMTEFMDIVGLAFFPAITSGILYQHLAKRYGPVSIIVYRLLLTLPTMLLPIAPAIPDVITSFVLLGLPMAIRVFIDTLYEKKVKYATKQRAGKLSYIGLASTFVLMATLVMLISGQFQYKMVVIATESMTGSLNVGDAVVYEEYEGEIVKEGDIVVFTKDDKTLVIHRVIDVQNLNGNVYYTTKGDFNETSDPGYITAANIRGVVCFKLPHIGHASLWLRELFS